MSRNVEEIFREVSDLPETERAELTGMLIDSLEGDRDASVEAAWAEEIERRVWQIDSGEVKTIPWEEVRAKLYARLHDQR
jgi:putative addiction module component (TIGR02574 family)